MRIRGQDRIAVTRNAHEQRIDDIRGSRSTDELACPPRSDLVGRFDASRREELCEHRLAPTIAPDLRHDRRGRDEPDPTCASSSKPGAGRGIAVLERDEHARVEHEIHRRRVFRRGFANSSASAFAINSA
ncbi:MAG TPA: hypothetical protein VIV58_06690, partial [Kofleriaceae bacterium]